MLAAVYVDLDGTLLGPGGSLFRAGDGGVSLEGARAVETVWRSGAELVVVTGRRQESAFQDARLLGCSAWVFELGCGIVLDGELEWLTAGLEPSSELGTIHFQITSSGALSLLLDAFPGRLAPHTPWSEGRDVSHLLRGEVDCAAANALLLDAGLEWLRLVDNGVLAAQGSLVSGADVGMPSVERVHAYHLMPAAASKAGGVQRHMRARGYAPEDCIAVGDSREDMEMVSAVSAFWLVANGAERDPDLAVDAARRPGVRMCTEAYGAGVHEAVATALAERGGG